MLEFVGDTDKPMQAVATSLKRKVDAAIGLLIHPLVWRRGCTVNVDLRLVQLDPSGEIKGVRHPSGHRKGALSLDPRR